MDGDGEREVWIDYTNWRGERRVRKIRPRTVVFTSTNYHTEQQWMLYANDCELASEPIKTFTLADIHRWSVTPIAAV